MSKEEFLEQMLDVLNREEEISLDDKLEDIDEWDSLGYVAFLAMAAEYTEKSIRASEVRGAKTVGDLYNLVAGE
ncbi:MAG: hypothetical protein IJU55_00110 [Selenomonadaceae bacterium]|nr:hypothetical protein [Selenomonadaceae bacterium]